MPLSTAAVSNPIGPAPPTSATCPGNDPAAHHRVVADGQRFDQRSLVQRDVADRVHPALVDSYDLLPQPAAATGQADEAHLFAQVVLPRFALRAHPTGEVRLHHDVLAHGKVHDSFAQRGDRPREFMPQGLDGASSCDSGCGCPGAGMKTGPLEVLVQVRSTDAAPGDVDGDRARAQNGFGDLFDPDVLLGVETCCLHGLAFRRHRTRGFS